ncbi:MAG: hypothetical protein M3024_13640, partial [Candidatus Dormibacteraeota bacterium]|nr:hypothetical protein [Candidatus Dormibacteraeota bacterium]
PTPNPTEQPGPSASPSASTPISPEQQHQEYRAYVAAAVANTAAVVAALSGVQPCFNEDRPGCLQAIGHASDQVDSFESDLSANPAPPCLTTADERLRDALTFWRRGLGTAHDAVQSENRVQLAQAALLTTAGTWRAGQAVVSARESAC